MSFKITMTQLTFDKICILLNLTIGLPEKVECKRFKREQSSKWG